MSSKQTAQITIDNEIKTVEIGTKISDILTIDMPCAGGGRCGKCKIIAKGALSKICESERKHLSKEELGLGVRLACKTYIMGKCSIFTDPPKASDQQILAHGRSLDFDTDPTFEKFGIAIDIGTTTLAANLYNTKGELLAAVSELNPQGKFGADVISRIEASLNGRSKDLADLIRGAIDNMVASLCENAAVSPKDVGALVITGNTAMLYLLTDSSPVTLSFAPFIADRYFGQSVTAKELGLTSLYENTEIYLPPCIAAFVGADTVCAILASGICNQNETSLLVDIGTNGEMALYNGKKLSVCSTAAGPAFEGVGICAGMRAASGAIDRVSIVNGSFFCRVIGDTKPIGICGSGLIDAVAALLDLELLDKTGYLEDDPVVISDQISLTGRDIRMIQLAKSAIYSGICTLMRSSQIPFEDIKTMYIAGGFGNYLNMRSAARVGVIPSELIDRIQVIGNAALVGASMLLLSKDLRSKAIEIAQSASVVELASDPIFAKLYMENMLF